MVKNQALAWTASAESKSRISSLRCSSPNTRIHIQLVIEYIQKLLADHLNSGRARHQSIAVINHVDWIFGGVPQRAMLNCSDNIGSSRLSVWNDSSCLWDFIAWFQSKFIVDACA
jgi:hypothetical protein